MKFITLFTVITSTYKSIIKLIKFIHSFIHSFIQLNKLKVIFARQHEANNLNKYSKKKTRCAFKLDTTYAQHNLLWKAQLLTSNEKYCMVLHSIPSAPRFFFAVILAFLRDVFRMMIFSTFSLGRECKRIERGLFVYFSCRFKRVKTVMQNFRVFFQENLT